MSNLFDIYNLIFLALAVAIFLRLRSVLGRRTGNERPPAELRRTPANDAAAAGDNVVNLPGAQPVPPPSPAEDREEQDRRLARAAPAGGPAIEGLRAIAAADRGFDVDGFLQGARAAYEMIVTAFAAGDRKTLKPLLSREVFEGFSAAIADRESRSETAETTFVGIERAEVTGAQLKGGVAQVTIRFVSNLIAITRDSSGAIIDGDPNKVSDVVDVWTFAREVASRDPNWKLVATESGE